MVLREELASLAEEIVEPVFVDKKQADRKYYQRKDRLDKPSMAIIQKCS
jgi:hypothetical protein